MTRFYFLLVSEVSVNLIDFEAPTPPAFGPTLQNKSLALESLLLEPSSSNNADEQTAPDDPGKDPFDMRKLRQKKNQ